MGNFVRNCEVGFETSENQIVSIGINASNRYGGDGSHCLEDAGHVFDLADDRPISVGNPQSYRCGCGEDKDHREYGYGPSDHAVVHRDDPSSSSTLPLSRKKGLMLILSGRLGLGSADVVEFARIQS